MKLELLAKNLNSIKLGLGTVLKQKNNIGWHHIANALHVITLAEKNYYPLELEAVEKRKISYFVLARNLIQH